MRNVAAGRDIMVHIPMRAVAEHIFSVEMVSSEPLILS